MHLIYHAVTRHFMKFYSNRFRFSSKRDIMKINWDVEHLKANLSDWMSSFFFGNILLSRAEIWFCEPLETILWDFKIHDLTFDSYFPFGRLVLRRLVKQMSVKFPIMKIFSLKISKCLVCFSPTLTVYSSLLHVFWKLHFTGK